ncbi:expressed unknown protein [Seminavis robusta]|uniref:DUF6824 domain-containing protein n=1 Tax=Seminavis robusta TaxID=568900 RepID=A0A9N8ECT3_9STRA|nr:expressed unknown protein [Seminavis robusta]|eukprot:Sro890_g216660.1 n/a (387) ;mRNA; f:3290-4547
MCVTKQFQTLQTMSFGNLSSFQPVPPVGNNAAALSSAAVNIIVAPRQFDVLCGKSKRCVDHDGSRRFRTVIECHRDRYEQALTKFDKTSVTRNIFDSMSQAGSRFLKHNEDLDVWEEISPMAARDKIGHALRFANRVARRRRTKGGASALAKEDSKPAATTTSQPLVSGAQGQLPQLPAQMGQLPVQPLSASPASYLGQSQQPAILSSSFAPLSRSSADTEEPSQQQHLPKMLLTMNGPVTISSSASILPSSFAQLNRDTAHQTTCEQPSSTATKFALPAASLVAVPTQLAMHHLPSIFCPMKNTEQQQRHITIAQVQEPTKALEKFSLPSSPVTTLNESLFLQNDSFLASANNKNTGPDQGFPVLEGDDMPFDWDFDAEILSVLL